MKGSEDVQETDGQRQKVHAGKLIHMLSHRLKRQNIIPCGDDGLTTMQKHVLKFILLETLHREIYQKDVEEEFQIRKSTATGILQLMENIRVMEKRLTKGISEEEFSMCMYVLWKMFDNLAQTETQQAEKKEENENNE